MLEDQEYAGKFVLSMGILWPAFDDDGGDYVQLNLT
jgi:hypothetical protein